MFLQKRHTWPQDNYWMVTPNTKLKNLHRTKVKIYQTTDLPSHQTDAYFDLQEFFKIYYR